MKQIKAILFDIDNTIGDSTMFLYNSNKESIERITKNKIDPIEKEAILQELVPWGFDGHRSNDEIYHILETKYKIKVTERFLKQSDWQRNAIKHFKLWPDTISTIKELKKRGYKVGILSNGHHPLQYTKLNNTGIINYMDAVTISSEAGYAKPDPGIFKVAAKRLGVKPEECAYVGDMYAIDVLGATRAKAMPIWIDRNNTYVEAKVTKIKRLKELLKIFK